MAVSQRVPTAEAVARVRTLFSLTLPTNLTCLSSVPDLPTDLPTTPFVSESCSQARHSSAFHRVRHGYYAVDRHGCMQHPYHASTSAPALRSVWMTFASVRSLRSCLPLDLYGQRSCMLLLLRFKATSLCAGSASNVRNTSCVMHLRQRQQCEAPVCSRQQQRPVQWLLLRDRDMRQRFLCWCAPLALVWCMPEPSRA